MQHTLANHDLTGSYHAFKQMTFLFITRKKNGISLRVAGVGVFCMYFVLLLFSLKESFRAK